MNAQFKLIILLLFLFGSGLFAQTNDKFVQRDLTELVQFVASQTDTNYQDIEDYQIWEHYLNKAHPNVETMERYFLEASSEFNVPLDLLRVIAQVENNWTQIGPSIDKGWGVMHLVENSYCQTLTEASQLLNLDAQILKDDAQQNIRGMAALMNEKAKEKRAELLEIADWFEIVKSCTGLYSDELAESQAKRYYDVLNQGNVSSTLWGEKIMLKPVSTDISKYLNPNNPYLFPSKENQSLDYPPAISNLTPCNFAEGRNHEIDAWVNHWVGVGTYAGAISWFHNCDAEVSAHFVIRSSDGEITQVVSVANTAWHCGASGYPYNNSRSIGVEHEATAANPELWNSMPMLTASAQMASYFCDEFGIPKTMSLPGIRGHNQMPGTNTACPGNLPWFTWMSLLDENYSYADLVIMGMGSIPETPNTFQDSELWVEIKNVGNDNADSIYLNYRINGTIIGYDSLISLEADESHTFVFPPYVFQGSGIMDFCVFMDPVSNESSVLNNSYCVDIEVLPASSLDETDFQKNIQIFPNPSTGFIHIRSGNYKIENIEIYDLNARLVKTFTSPIPSQIDIQALPKGIYIMKFCDEKGNITRSRLLKL